MQATIKEGIIRGNRVENVKVDLLSPDIKTMPSGKSYVVVEGKSVDAPGKTARIFINDATQVLFEHTQKEETDQDIIKRIEQRFSIMTDLVGGVVNSKLRGLIISGAAGTGKTYGVKQILENENPGVIFNPDARKPFEIMKGYSTACSLFSKLYEYRNKNDVLCLDDCDNIFHDENALNLLKAALDTTHKELHWNTMRNNFTKEIPTSFKFEGGVVIITNLNVSQIRSEAIKRHLDALEDRIPSLNLTVHTDKEKLLYIKHMILNGSLFAKNPISEEHRAEILQYIEKNMYNFKRGVSLRLAIQLAEYQEVSEANWQKYANNTLLK